MEEGERDQKNVNTLYAWREMLIMSAKLKAFHSYLVFIVLYYRIQKACMHLNGWFLSGRLVFFSLSRFLFLPLMMSVCQLKIP